MKTKYLSEHEQRLKQKQLESWSRWVDARVIYRKLKPNPPDWFKWLESALDGTHYTLTEETFNLIKEKYEKEKESTTTKSKSTISQSY
jgi:hypothetical protein